MTALLDTYLRTVANVGDLHRARAQALGVPLETIWAAPASFGVARIETSGRYFQIAATGRPALILPASTCYDDIDLFVEGLADLVAFHTDDPSHWWVLRDAVPVLNLDAVAWSQPCMGIDHALAVYSTPLSFLQHDRDGVCVLDWQSSVWFDLAGPVRVWCDTPELEIRLRNAWSGPLDQMPEIRSGEARHAA